MGFDWSLWHWYFVSSANLSLFQWHLLIGVISVVASTIVREVIVVKTDKEVD